MFPVVDLSAESAFYCFFIVGDATQVKIRNNPIYPESLKTRDPQKVGYLLFVPPVYVPLLSIALSNARPVVPCTGWHRIVGHTSYPRHTHTGVILVSYEELFELRLPIVVSNSSSSSSSTRTIGFAYELASPGVLNRPQTVYPGHGTGHHRGRRHDHHHQADSLRILLCVAVLTHSSPGAVHSSRASNT